MKTYELKTDRKAWDVMLERATSLKKKPSIDVGFPADGKLGNPTRKGSGHKPYASMAELATVMATHEYGSADGRIPGRPFMRMSVYLNESKLEKLQQKVATSILIGDITVREGLDKVGKFMVEGIKNEIRQLEDPPLKPATIKRKGRTDLLRDTNQAYNSVQFVSKVKR